MSRGGELTGLTRFELWYGRDEAPLHPQEVHAGPLSAMVVGPDLRYIQLGELEIVRRIFMAVRGPNWDTVQYEISDYVLDAMEDKFFLSFLARSCSDELALEWRGSVRGSSKGSISYEFDGAAATAFRYCRIGICVLHPPEFAGRPYRARTSRGDIEGTLPRLVGPQLVENGLELPLFPSFERLTVELEGRLEVDLRFEGDLFEMEDQRNWTDASFKTYSTPLALGYPHEARAGQRFRQLVAIEPLNAWSRSSLRARPDHVGLTLGPAVGRLPPIGFGLAADELPLASEEAELLRETSPAHLRVDLDLSDTSYPSLLYRAVEEAQALACELELALLVTEDAKRELADVVGRLTKTAVARLLLFSAHAPATPAGLAATARAILQDALPTTTLVGGTNAYFAQLNAFRPVLDGLDALAYSVNPQVHAFDEASLAETLAAQAETVRTAQSFASGKAVIVSPVTLRPRFNPDAVEHATRPASDQVPSSVDPRQLSLFGAGWTVGSVKHLAESGAAAMTYYETTGWRGLLESFGARTRPRAFPSRPGMLFPLFHVFADLAGWRDCEILACQSSDPLSVEGLALSRSGELRLLIANLSHITRRIDLGPVRNATVVSVRYLDETTADTAMFDPHEFRDNADELPVEMRRAALTLLPFAVATIDMEAA